MNRVAPQMLPRVPTRRRQKLLDQLHVRAFQMYFRRIFRSEPDPLLRFVKALLASSRPMRRPDLAEQWMRQQLANDGRRRGKEPNGARR
jgi:hypothetical protein